MAKKEQEDKFDISKEMVKKCKADIAKFGFKIGDFEKFLIYAKALKSDGTTVLQYRNEQLSDYSKAFIKKNEVTLSDAFVLDKFKILTSKEDGNRSIQYETGYFCPRSFWEFILDYKLN